MIQRQDPPNEAKLDAATDAPVPKVSVQIGQGCQRMSGTMHCKAANRTFPGVLPIATCAVATTKTLKVDAGSDYASHHRGDSMGADPRADCSSKSNDSNRKRRQHESTMNRQLAPSHKKYKLPNSFQSSL